MTRYSPLRDAQELVRNFVVVVVSGAVVSLAGCDSGEKSPGGFRLPDGDAQRGRETFVALRCHACHRVYDLDKDLDLPEPVADPAVPVILGGRRSSVVTDGELVTAIIYPSYAVSRRYPSHFVGSRGNSRMADYSELMTIQQLVDLVAFLHSCYEVVPPPRF